MFMTRKRSLLSQDNLIINCDLEILAMKKQIGPLLVLDLCTNQMSHHQTVKQNDNLSYLFE